MKILIKKMIKFNFESKLIKTSANLEIPKKPKNKNILYSMELYSQH